MKKPTKFFFLVALVAVLTVFAGGVYAQSNEGGSFKLPFVSQLAERLDMDEEELSVLVEEVRQEHRAQMQESRTETIQQAFEEGKLTERQMEILTAREEFRGNGRQRGAIVDILNEEGLNVNHEEMEELRDVMIELEIGGKGQGRGWQR